MADPKYANLPGIDVNSPDVYETSDLPEDEQALAKAPEELESESVETVALDTRAAYKAFKGKGVSASGVVDFSDSVGKARKAGYYSDRTEYELGDGSSPETPLQKFQRLQHEIRELTEEVSKAKETVKGDAGSDKMSPVNLGQQLQYLQHQLTDLHLEKLLGPEASIDLSDPQGALRQRLLQQLSSYTPPAPSKDKPQPQGAGGEGDYVTYELYYRPEQAQFSKNARMANLEERLERLENAIGQNMDKVGVLTTDTENKSLLGAVAALNTKLALLDQPNVDAVEARLQSVLHKLNQIADKKSAQENPERQQKVSELYDLVKKWEVVGDSLPQVVDRMVALKDLHEQALQFSQALTYLDTSQQEVKSNLDTHSDMLKKLQASFKENTDSIKSNFETLDKRMQAVKK